MLYSHRVLAFAGALCGGCLLGVALLWRFNPEALPRRMTRKEWKVVGSPRWQRPYGMAPQAFAAYLHACDELKISPARIGQTIGDHPRSAGYHKRDGVLKIGGEAIDYCAAVDLAVDDLNDAQIQRFLAAMGKRGFAAWYRHGPKWKNGEHVHAIYALVPMKPQLRGQVREWLHDRRIAQGKPYRWETMLRRQWRLRRT